MRTPPDHISAPAINFPHTISSTREEELELERFWSLEAIGISPRSERNGSEVFLEHYCKTSIARNENVSIVQSSPGNTIHPLFQQTILGSFNTHETLLSTRKSNSREETGSTTAYET